MIAAAIRDFAARIPNGTLKMMAIALATITIASVSIAFSHCPTPEMSSSPRTEPAARIHRRASTASPAITRMITQNGGPLRKNSAQR